MTLNSVEFVRWSSVFDTLRDVCLGIALLVTIGLSASKSHAQVAVDSKGEIVFGAEDAKIGIVSYISLNCAPCERWFEVFHAPILDEIAKNPNLKHVIKLVSLSDNEKEKANVAFASGLTACAKFPMELKVAFVQFWLRERGRWLALSDKLEIAQIGMASGRGLDKGKWPECAERHEAAVIDQSREILELTDEGAYPVSAVGPIMADGRVVVADTAFTASDKGAARLIAVIKGIGQGDGIDQTFPKLVQLHEVAKKKAEKEKRCYEIYDKIFYKKDYTAALRLAESLAAESHPGAQYLLAEIYWFGLGVDKDVSAAMHWYEAAAQSGQAHAASKLASRYIGGRAGVGKDGALAARWARVAADQGEVFAQRLLGEMHYWGEFVEKDFKRAYILIELSIRDFRDQPPGDEFQKTDFDDAEEWLRRLERTMPPSEVEEARRLAQDWIKKNRNSPFHWHTSGISACREPAKGAATD